MSIAQFCKAAKARYEQCADFDAKRQFMLDHVEQVIFVRDKVTFCGAVPVGTRAGREGDGPDGDAEMGRLEFRIEGRIGRPTETIPVSLPTSIHRQESWSS